MMFIASEYKTTHDNDISKITYSKDEFIQNCAYNTKPCNVINDFSHRTDPIYGACYTFNDAPEDTAPKYKSTRAGPLYGLRLLLKSNQTEYLPLTESAGVRVAVHKQGEEPFPDAFGYNAAAGFTTSFGIKFVPTPSLCRCRVGEGDQGVVADPNGAQGGAVGELHAGRRPRRLLLRLQVLRGGLLPLLLPGLALPSRLRWEGSEAHCRRTS